MPSNKNALTRIRILDELLSDSYHGYTLDEIVGIVNDRLAEMSVEPVTRRCVEKDIAYIEGENSPFAMEVERYPVARYDAESGMTVRKQCLRYRYSGSSIFKKDLSYEEKKLMAEVFNLLGQFDGLPDFSVLEGIRSGLVDKSDKPVVSFSRNPKFSRPNLFGQLFSAITHRQSIDLFYHLFPAPGDVRVIPAYPYFLKEYNGRWYLFCAHAETGKLLSFALDRIDDAVPHPERGYVDFEGDWNSYFENIIGVTRNEGPVLEIVFWASDAGNCRSYVETKPLHESQVRIRRDEALRKSFPLLEGGAFFRIECIENYELVRELCSYGRNLLVLSPEELRDKVFARMDETSEAYRTLFPKYCR